MNLERVILLLITFMLPAAVSPQTFQLEGKWQTARWTRGSWNGEHRLPPVYCVKFPAANAALQMGHGFYNRNSIYLTQVLYPENIGAFIVTSTIPAGRSEDEEITRLLLGERDAETAYGTSYNITEMQTVLGRTIGLKIRNVAPQGGNAPFPLVRPIIRAPRAPIETLSVHRIFVRGPDRFEVATAQLAPTSATDVTEAEMTQRLTVLADEIVSSLQSCTTTMPVRSPR
jgi:hypothetical protein